MNMRDGLDDILDLNEDTEHESGETSVGKMKSERKESETSVGKMKPDREKTGKKPGKENRNRSSKEDFDEDFEEDFEEISLSEFEDDDEDDDADLATKRARRNRKRRKKERESDIKEFFSWVLTFACAILVALFLKNFVIINATVPTGSMENTIMPGDDMLGFRLSYMFSDPQRGDIIIFRFPDDESQKYVKRIIGLPGEKVTIRDGYVYINDSVEPLLELYLKEEWVRGTGPYVFEVPEDSYFVMGDNRNDSHDSRYWINTYVTRDKIIGKAQFIYYPFSHMKLLE